MALEDLSLSITSVNITDGATRERFEVVINIESKLSNFAIKHKDVSKDYIINLLYLRGLCSINQEQIFNLVWP